ncbi:Lrp/AsnC family transcriptional regulator [Rhodococcoides kyotonense]|uniref:DNA-binding transcriptional regulator, Lrp family n=1 Tax=Rhodococcoides kyotonense TaxID=398843 RepID=A0A239MY66_9NOCA|nr:AsnC family transcriptional regulator [Rhodococcus kyotonensis]SNT47747.1 DNA-binding transcriptional regulator, Lrp family [Rhodococcus kyotonensis]
MDYVNATILRALQIDPRASFRLLGDISGVSEQTAARRYRALRRSGAIRAVGLVNPAVQRQVQWIARLRCRPDRVETLARSLARRPEVAYAHIASGGAEIICIVHAPIEAAGDDLLLNGLPQSTTVLDIRIELLMHSFGTRGTTHWTGFGGTLTAAQFSMLRPRDMVVADQPPPPSLDDQPLISALAANGRASIRELARAADLPEASVRSRIQNLEKVGTLRFDLEFLPEKLGFHLNATLWLRIAPSSLEHVGTALSDHAEVAAAAAISGEYNLMAIVVCKNSDHLYRYMSTQVASISGILGYAVSIRVRRLKQAVSLVAHGRLIRPM